MELILIKDIAVASFLLCSDRVKLVKTEREGKKLVIFCFAPKEEAEKLISSYWSDTAQVSPRKLFSAQRSLKDLIFSGS
jgi:hypothetical protein